MSQPIVHTEDDKLITEVLNRSATDKDYRNRLLTQPEKAIEEIVGVPLSSLPKAYRIRFVEKEPGLDALVVLPDLQDPEGVLSDAELEAVAGGDFCITSCGFSITLCRITDDNKITCQA